MINSQAYASIIKSLRWKSYAILYEDVDDLVHLQGLIGEQNIKPDFMAYLGETQDFRFSIQSLIIIELSLQRY